MLNFEDDFAQQGQVLVEQRSQVEVVAVEVDFAISRF